MIFQYKNHEFDSDTDITVDLWPSSKWSVEELSQLKNIFEEFGETSGQLSSEPRGLSIQIGIQFISSIVASAFLGALAKKFGDDTYDYLKKEIKNLALKKNLILRIKKTLPIRVIFFSDILIKKIL